MQFRELLTNNKAGGSARISGAGLLAPWNPKSMGKATGGQVSFSFRLTRRDVVLGEPHVQSFVKKEAQTG
jgi:hypothetical protein